MKIEFDKTIVQNAYSKINLFLEVGAKMENGYHNITSVMHTISLHDKVSLKVSKGEGIEVNVIGEKDLSNESNIAYKAAELYLKKIDYPCRIKIEIEKNIPVRAGLGGGSCDAGATLLLLNQAFCNKLSKEELESLAKQLGADVPFATRGGCVLATGIGENMKDLTPLPKCYVLVVKHGEKKSTKEVYQSLDNIENRTLLGEKLFLDAIEGGNIDQIAKKLYNSFSKVVNISNEVREELDISSCLGYTLCGAGPSVIAIFDNEEKAKKTEQALNKKGIFATVCEPVNNKY